MSGWPLICPAAGVPSHFTGDAGGWGATVRLTKPVKGYPHAGPDDANLSNAAAFDGLLGVPGAKLRQKIYLQACDDPKVGLKKGLPTTLPAGWVPFAAQGGTLTISAKPPVSFTPNGDQAFLAFVTALEAQLGDGYELSLWQEEDQSQFGFTPATYAAYAGHYTSLFLTAASSAKLVLNLALTAPSDGSSEQTVVATIQACAKVPWSKLLLDYYCTSWRRGGRIENALAAADALNLPVGIGETGAAASNMPFDRSAWESFCDYLADLFRARRAAGRDNAQIMYWMGSAASGSGANWLLTDDEKLPGVLRLARVATGAS